MDISLRHCFAEHDARLDDVLLLLRGESRHGNGRRARGLAARALQQVKRQRHIFSLDGVEMGDVARRLARASFRQEVRREIEVWVGGQAKQLRLNPVMEALDATWYAVEERRVVRHLLVFHLSRAAKVASKSALLIWALARDVWRKLAAQARIRFPNLRANGFFGADKVDGRNLP